MSDRGQCEVGSLEIEAHGAVPREPQRQKRVCLLVLGMHRSGTSAFARVLSLLGAALPRDLLGAGPGNEKGHWEPEPLVTFHDRMLADLGSRWDDWRKLDLDRVSAGRLASIRDDLSGLIEEQYGSAPLIVLKEPRICRFVPLYSEVLEGLVLELRCVMPVRNPLAVTASLQARDGMTQGFAALLWLRHVLDAEAATRGWPRSIVSYEALLADWQPLMRRTAARLGLAWSRPIDEVAPEIAAFLSAEHQHHAPSRRELAAQQDVAEWVKAAYEALLRLGQDSDDETAFAQLDRIRAEFDPVCPAFGAAMFAELAAREARHGAERERLAAKAAGARAILHVREGDLAHARTELAARDKRIGALLAKLAGRNERAGTLKASLLQRDGQIKALRREVASRDERIATLEEREELLAALRREVAQRDDQISELQAAHDMRARAAEAALAVKEEESTSLRTEIAARDEHVGALQRELAANEERMHGLLGERGSLLADLETARRRTAELTIQLDRWATDRAAADARIAFLEGELEEVQQTTAPAHLRTGEVAADSERLAVELRARSIEVSTLKASLATQASDLARIYTSRSWRLTSPLRGTARMLRREVSVRHTLHCAAEKLFRAAPIPDQAKHYLRHAVRRLARVRPHPTQFWFGPDRPPPPPQNANPPGASPPATSGVQVNPTPSPPSALFPQGPVSALAASVSVVIPTYNAGPEFRQLLNKLTAQKGLAQIEIIVIDSGSDDPTPDLARHFGCKVHSIDKADFSHSFSRNIGAELAKGDFLLFTVQDAYPVGDHWIYALTKALSEGRVHLPSLAAISCAEFPRGDSEILYDSCVDTHYSFLNCALADRYGKFVGDDHLSLRKHGQISDVACLIPRSLFGKYGYSGNYAEDLNLGIRLLREGYNLGMLSSIKVIHSHNRPPHYHLRRSFTDVLYLAKCFADFPRPQLSNARGVVSAVAMALRGTRRILSHGPRLSETPGGYLRRIASECTNETLADPECGAEELSFGLAPLAAFLRSELLSESNGSPPQSAEHRAAVSDTLALYRAKLNHIASFAERVYPSLDPFLRKELDCAATKTLAGTFGAQLAFLALLAENGTVQDMSPSGAHRLGPVLTAGI